MNQAARFRPCRYRLGAILAVCLLCAGTQLSQAQIGLGRGPGRPGGGLGLGGDDEETRKAKAAAQKQQEAAKLLDEGLKFLEKDRIPEAKGRFKTVIELVGLEGSGRAAFDQLVALHREGMARLEQAADLFEQKQFVQALELAKRTKVLFANLFAGIPGTSQYPVVSQEAGLLIKRIEGDPEAKLAIQDDGALKLLPKVERLEQKVQQDPSRYYELYLALHRIVKRYPDCPTGKDCAKRLQLLMENEKAAKIIQREKDRRTIEAALAQIDGYEKAGEAAKAKAERAQLLKQFPGKTMEELRKLAKH